MINLQTERLELKILSIADAPFILKLFNSPGWIKNIGDRNVHSEEEAKTYIEKKYLPSSEKHGFGTFACVLKETGETIGTCGLYKRDNLKSVDIGFALLPQYFGKGYAHEAATAVIEYARETLKLKTILGITTKTNSSSIKLLQKIGLRQKGSYYFEDAKEELLLFST